MLFADEDDVTRAVDVRRDSPRCGHEGINIWFRDLRFRFFILSMVSFCTFICLHASSYDVSE